MNIDELREELIIDEGKRLDVYMCTGDPPKATVGIGHMIRDADPESSLAVGDTITEERCQELFDEDIEGVIEDCDRLIRNFPLLEPEAQKICANMMFNLGMNRLGKFNNFLNALNEDPPNYTLAASEMRDSRWYRQVTNRAERLARRMEDLDRG